MLVTLRHNLVNNVKLPKLSGLEHWWLTQEMLVSQQDHIMTSSPAVYTSNVVTGPQEKEWGWLWSKWGAEMPSHWKGHKKWEAAVYPGDSFSCWSCQKAVCVCSQPRGNEVLAVLPIISGTISLWRSPFRYHCHVEWDLIFSFWNMVNCILGWPWTCL